MRQEPGIPPPGLPVDDRAARPGRRARPRRRTGRRAALLAAAEAGQYAVLLEKTGRRSAARRSAPPGCRPTPAPTSRPSRASPTPSSCCARTCSRPAAHVNDEALVDLYCERQLDTYRWLKAHGVAYGDIHAASGQSAPRSHPTDTTAMLRAPASRQPGALGARLVLGRRRPAGIVHDGRPGHRRASSSAHGGQRTGPGRRGRARHRRLLARAASMLERFAPQMEHALLAGGEGNDGRRPADGHDSSAPGSRDLPYVKGTYGIFHEPHPAEDGTGILAVYKGAIAVNRDGPPVRRRVHPLQGARRRQPGAAGRHAPGRSSTPR